MTLNDIRKIQSRIDNLKQKHELRSDDYVKEHCPYKVGDLITVAGYSHKGKQLMIDGIELKQGFGWNDQPLSYGFVYTGGIVNKNGRVGELYTSFEVKIKEGEDE